MTEGVLLRFVRVHDVHINTQRDYDAEWLQGSVELLLDDDSIIWAVTDADGNPVEMPPDRIDQVWSVYGRTEEKHFELKEFEGDWDAILKPYYERWPSGQILK